MKKIVFCSALLLSAPAAAFFGDNGDFGDGYGSTWGNTYGYGDGYGRGYGDGRAYGDMDGSFDMAISGRAKARGDANTRQTRNFSGNWRGYGDWYGQGYSQPYYGYPAYGYRPYPYWGYPMQAAMPQRPADDDRDGVINGTDLCPQTPAGTRVDALGCGEAARIVLRGVNFKTDSDELTPQSLSILNGVSRTLAANPQLKIMVAGHTDSDGDQAYNKDLSQRRAQSVVNYLVSKKVDANNLIAKGFGEEQPIASNSSPQGKAQNRRVELNRL